MRQAKPFPISKRQVWEAYRRVKANQGGAGVDGQTLEEFEQKLGDNLYKLWNRMASGSYMPPAVKRVEIPKGDGRVRPLGIPTVADRIAQMVVKQVLEPELERVFHPDSYGYRPGKSAHQALAQARQRCWRNAWAVDLDIKGFFDNIDHSLMLRALRRHTQENWVLLYVERWLKAEVELPDGRREARERGTPQGGVVSPQLANLFLHYTFDMWMQREFPSIAFERYADDAVCHCRTEAQARYLKARLERRFAECRLELHPEKTKIVYCKDDNRAGEFPQTKFDFLGYTFRARLVRRGDGKFFVGFSPAISNKSAKAIRQTVRGWALQRRTNQSLHELARAYDPAIRGWVNYYGAFHKSAVWPTLRQIDRRLAWWAHSKHKRLRGHKRRAAHWVRRTARRDPDLFAHWRLMYGRAG